MFTTTGPHDALGDVDRRAQLAADVWLGVGLCMVATMVLGVPGAVVAGYGVVRQVRVHRASKATRPLAVTVIGFGCLLSAASQLAFYSFDLLPVHDTEVVRTLLTGIGRMTDGGYYLAFNDTAIGGTALPGEKSFTIAAVLMLFPPYLIACWAFLQLKRWGFQFLATSALMYLTYSIGRFFLASHAYPLKFPNAEFGLTGWWFSHAPHLCILLVLPYLLTVERTLWTD